MEAHARTAARAELRQVVGRQCRAVRRTEKELREILRSLERRKLAARARLAIERAVASLSAATHELGLLHELSDFGKRSRFAPLDLAGIVPGLREPAWVRTDPAALADLLAAFRPLIGTSWGRAVASVMADAGRRAVTIELSPLRIRGPLAVLLADAVELSYAHLRLVGSGVFLALEASSPSSSGTTPPKNPTSVERTMP